MEDWFEELALQVTEALIRRFEGLFLHPYICPAGYPTIGYGARYYPDGRAVRLSDPAITKEAAEEMLHYAVRNVYLPAVLQLCRGIDTPQRLAALVDFCFNLGSSKLKASSLRRRVNEGNWGAVPSEIRKWVYGGGRILKGLVLRAEARCRLI